MNRKQILEHVRNHARDVSDLAKVALIETTQDPRLAKIETSVLVQKYGAEYETARREADFNEIFGDW